MSNLISKMRIDILSNQTLGRVSAPAPWIFGHSSPQMLKLSILAERETEIGHHVGLSQTVLHSTRAAAYEEGLLWFTVPQGPGKQSPWLDGDEDTIPWYSQDAWASLPALDTPVTIALQDSPAVRTPRYVWSLDPGQRKRCQLRMLVVADTFLVSLLDLNATDNVIRQWSWGYSYVIRRNVSNPRQDRISRYSMQGMLELDTRVEPQTTGPVANSASVPLVVHISEVLGAPWAQGQ